jgi:hypothetical protein
MLELTETQALLLLDLLEDQILMEKEVLQVERLEPEDYYIEQLEIIATMFKEDLNRTDL